MDFHILGGEPVLIGEFPHMAALGFQSEEIGRTFEYDCGATIIAERWLLTAAHCITRSRPPVIARYGLIDVDADGDGAGTTLSVVQVVTHPLYRRPATYHDIALLRLNDTIRFDNNQRPACLHTDAADLRGAGDLWVSGWGLTELGRRSPVLLKANLTAVDLAPCNVSITGYGAMPTRRLPVGLIGGQVCAADADGRRDACQGDSGGPLQVRGEQETWSVVGVVSFGVFCGTKLPSVYTRVASYVDWIESVVWPDGFRS